MSTKTERVVICSRFWPRYLRWAVGFQLALALFVGLVVALRGVNGVLLWRAEEAVTWGSLSGVLAAVALIATVRRRNFGSAEITPRGIRIVDPRNFHSWACLRTVRVKAGPFGNRWLEVSPDYCPAFKLPARPSNPDAVLEALEEFAGPDHPLTQAYFTLLDR